MRPPFKVEQNVDKQGWRLKRGGHRNLRKARRYIEEMQHDRDLTRASRPGVILPAIEVQIRDANNVVIGKPRRLI